MLAFLKTDNGRSRRWQPHVLHLNDLLAVDTEIVAASHLLTDVKQQGVVASFLDVNSCLEEVSATHLATVSLCGGNVDDLGGTGSRLAGCHRHTLAARVELHKAVVIPQHAVALAREEHGQADLCVHLCQTARQSAHIRETVLELTQSIEMLVFRRSEGQRSLAAGHLVAGSGKDHPTLLVLERQPLALLIDINTDLAVLDFVMTDINPVGQTTLCGCLDILDTHGIASNRGHGELSLSERNGGGRRNSKADGQQDCEEGFSHDVSLNG